MRAAWRKLICEEIDTGRLVFVDEVGSNTTLSSLFAWARRGGRAYGKAPRNRSKNTTLLASISAEGRGSCVAVVRSAKKAVFESYVELILAPSLPPGQVVVKEK